MNVGEVRDLHERAQPESKASRARAVARPLAGRMGIGPEQLAFRTGASNPRGPRAVAESSDNTISLLAGAPSPESLAGHLVIAHELAHTRQPIKAGASESDSERDADLTALRAVVGAGHRSLDGLPLDRVGAAIGEPTTPGTRPPGPRSCTDDPSRDWEGQGLTSAEDAARHIRIQFNARERLLNQPVLTEADHEQLDEIEGALARHISHLRDLGIQLPIDDLYARILDDTPMDDIMEVGLEGIDGAEPPTILWGERRRFAARVGYLPPSVDVRYRWKLREGQRTIPLMGATSASRTAELGTEFWTRWTYDESTGWDAPDSLIVGATLQVGNRTIDHEWTPRLELRHGVPDSLDLGVSPMAPPRPGDAPDATPRVLVGARVTISPSWFPRHAPGLGGPSHLLWWTITRGSGPVNEGWGMVGHGDFDEPGRYLVTADLHPFPRASGRPPAGRPLLRSRIEIDAVDSSELARQSIGLVESRLRGMEYAEYRDELAARVTEAEMVRLTGSTEQDEVDERHEALVEMQREVRRHVETTSEYADIPAQPPQYSGDTIGGQPIGTRGTPAHRDLVTRRRSSAPLPFPDSDDRFSESQYYAQLLPAVLVHPSVGIPQPLTIFTQLHHDGERWRAKLVDATTRDVVRHQGTGIHPHAAIAAAIRDWQEDNEYPRGGHVHYRFRPFPGWSLDGTFSTSSWEKAILEWFDTVLFVAGAIVGVLLLLVPEPSGITKAAGYALLVASVMRATYSIYQSLDLGRPPLHERHILEAVGIVASIIGLRGGSQMAGAAGTAARGEALAGRALTQFQVGRGMVYASAALDAGTFVYAAAGALPQIRRALDDDATNDQDAALLRIVGQLALQGLLIIGSNRDLFRGVPAVGSGRRGIAGLLAGDAEDALRLAPDQRTRIEGELRRLGVNEDVSGLTDTELLTRFQNASFSAHGDAAAAARATAVDDYVAALRRPGEDPGDVGGRWDWSRFDGYPEGQRWQPGDPIDAPHRTRSGEWVYPDYNAQGRYRYWRNRAHFELEARRRHGRGPDTSDVSDPIRSMSNAELATMAANRTPRSPRDAGDNIIELEHSGIPQRVTTALTELGLSASDARRLTGASDPGNLMPVTGVEHAFFDAYAQYRDAHAANPRALNRARTDADGATWQHTLGGDERVHRPLALMSDEAFDGLVGAIRRGGHDSNLGSTARTRRLRNWLRREARARGLPDPFPTTQ
ncbi:MAG: DUF4157 domain-containing protein [Actinomycetota bacterium]